jgi:hypothetical protein
MRGIEPLVAEPWGIPIPVRSSGLVRTRAAALFGLDLRSLALFRVATALVVLGDLAQRAVDLRPHYTDFGVLPRAALIERFSGDWAISLHLASGRVEFQAFLFGFHALCALCLMLGLRTRIATAACWILCCSLHARNPMVLQGGDDLLRLLLFWSLFLPLGARGSLDGAGRSPQDVTQRSSLWLSAGTLALTLQICAVYWCTAAYKAHPAWTSTGNAIYLALNIDQMARPLGQALLKFPWLLRPLALGTVWFERLGPLLLFLPVRRGLFRTVAVLLFLGFHAALGLSLQLGVFPFVCAAAWLAFLPGRFWEQSWVRRSLGRLQKIAPLRSVSRTLERFVAPQHRMEASDDRRLSAIIPLTALGAVMVWNVAGLVPERAARLPGLERLIWTARLEQSWRMFSPFPLTDDGWYVMPGRLRNGSEVDVVTGRDVRWEKPQDVSATYPNDRWRKYMMNVWSRANAGHRLYLARYLCRQWNEEHAFPEQLLSFDITFMLERTVEPGEMPRPERVLLWEHHCF